MNNPKILVFLALSFLSAQASAAYDEIQKIPIDMIVTAGQSSFVIMKTDDGPIWLIHRNSEQIEFLKSNPAALEDTSDLLRSQRPDIFVVIPKCSCTGKTATYLEPGHPLLGGVIIGGFLCEKDVSVLDLAGRVLSSTCDGKDFTIPKYKIIDDEYIEIDPNDT